MSYIPLTKQDIAELIDEQISKVHLIQLKIGKLFYPYRNDTELMKILSADYGNLDYVKSCVKVYEGSMILD